MINNDKYVVVYNSSVYITEDGFCTGEEAEQIRKRLGGGVVTPVEAMDPTKVTHETLDQDLHDATDYVELTIDMNDMVGILHREVTKLLKNGGDLHIDRLNWVKERIGKMEACDMDLCNVNDALEKAAASLIRIWLMRGEGL